MTGTPGADWDAPTIPTPREDLRDAVRRSLSRDPDVLQDAAP
ncbi:MAG TPA: hypothetical protein VFM55_19100 [Micromonosporaceae bacterium]|nr:hypothetical protein [Micromonosporaceae bacterium]